MKKRISEPQPDTYSCVTITTPAELADHEAQWGELARRSLDTHIYMSPAYLKTILEYCPPQSSHFILLVYHVQNSQKTLVAFAAFMSNPSGAGSFVPFLSNFNLPYMFLSYPLLDPAHASQAVVKILDEIGRQKPNGHYLNLSQVPESSAFWSLLKQELHARKRRYWVKDSFQRAILKPHESFEHFIDSLSRDRRKSWRRKWRSLEKTGTVEVEVHRTLDRAPDLAARFMQLEALGWKGDSGTALLQSRRDALFFEALVESLAKKHALFFIELKLDGKPIAMSSNFTCGERLFAFKIAYDPEYRDYSPGLLAEIELIREFHHNQEFCFADSGTSGASYLDAYWRQTDTIQTIMVSTGSRRSDNFVFLIQTLTSMKRRLRATLGEMFQRQ